MTESRQVDLNDPSLQDVQVELESGDRSDDEVLPPCEFVCGAAGTGKTFEMKRRIQEDVKYGLLAASTGVAAMNLGTVTINSILKYYDTASLEEAFVSGRLTRTMHDLAKTYKRLIIDEVSMVERRQLELFYESAKQANHYKDVTNSLGLVLVGDFAQLPPVSGEWAFDSECWVYFDANTCRLQKNWRQGDGQFLEALTQLRAGRGADASSLMKDSVHFQRELDPNFDGTVIMGRNDDVDRYNWSRYTRLKGTEKSYQSRRWGKESGGWKLVPDALKLRVGTLVTITANDSPEFTYVNGDMGHIVSIDESEFVRIELLRTKGVVTVPYIERRTEQKHAPEGVDDDQVVAAQKSYIKLPNGTFYDRNKKRWILGSIIYLPVRYGYATTVHRSQGLTLDRVMVDLRNAFMGAPNMAYVSCSRVRAADGLYLIGSPEMLTKRTNCHPKVTRWL